MTWYSRGCNTVETKHCFNLWPQFDLPALGLNAKILKEVNRKNKWPLQLVHLADQINGGCSKPGQIFVETGNSTQTHHMRLIKKVVIFWAAVVAGGGWYLSMFKFGIIDYRGRPRVFTSYVTGLIYTLHNLIKKLFKIPLSFSWRARDLIPSNKIFWKHKWGEQSMQKSQHLSPPLLIVNSQVKECD